MNDRFVQRPARIRRFLVGATLLQVILSWPSGARAAVSDLNVTQYGVGCVVGVDDSAALSNAAALAGAVGLGLVIPCAVQVHAPVLPAIAVPVRFEGGGALNIVRRGSVKFTGPLEAPLKPIFLRDGMRWWFSPDLNAKANELTLTDLTQARTPEIHPEWWGADPTGTELSNAAFDAAKAARRTVNLSAGIYRIEGYMAEDLRLIGVRAIGANEPESAQTVIEGDGDIFTDANNFSMQYLTIRNRRLPDGTRKLGTLVSIKSMNTGLGPFVSVHFDWANYHIYQASSVHAVVGLSIQDCRFTNAEVASRQFQGGLNRYSETSCYTTTNRAGLVFGSTSSTLIADSVFEYQEQEAIRVAITNPSATFFGLKLSNIHFEGNGCPAPRNSEGKCVAKNAEGVDVTEGQHCPVPRNNNGTCAAEPAALSPDITLSSGLDPRFGPALIDLQDLSFNVPVRPGGTVALSGSYLDINEVNCHGLAYVGRTPEIQIHQSSGGGAMSATITETATRLFPMPSSFEGMLIVVRDATTEGAALLLLTTNGVNVISSTLTSVAFEILSYDHANYLYAKTTGGSSWRVLYWTRLRT